MNSTSVILMNRLSTYLMETDTARQAFEAWLCDGHSCGCEGEDHDRQLDEEIQSVLSEIRMGTTSFIMMTSIGVGSTGPTPPGT